MIFLYYSTVDGQTKRIAEKIESVLKENGERVTIKEIEEKTVTDDYTFSGNDKVILLASIRYGFFPKKVYRFVEKARLANVSCESYFIGVNLIARNVEKQSVENNVYVRKFLEKITWQPTKVKIFAGALNYTKYNFFDKKMIQLIMKITNGPTDASVDTDFTDWASVKEFAESLIAE
ncbi:menaquinone-dependent protoporphyrinogen oxidase [Pilibacter termitis]|uniref:Protoporphyrinogen IX dehydrogenase [quinone] n=1 Tax=Pilibacter termitis TaxID=263852 RepID=A0A1T4M7K1_9ENTE|nr:menaquinone-dependent protoporphyrinogen IX dehydrogenase [Pilibacter termitis]SJZ62816.1 menaquinone-dependent protoporphyrinogen oxidase [Pilibacter termitis]